MKKFCIFIMVLFVLFSFVAIATATDVIMSGKLTNVTQRVTKNGDPYVIIALPESKELNGVKYATETSIFCFKNEQAKKLKVGDEVKLIAKRSISKDGNEFVTLIQFVK